MWLRNAWYVAGWSHELGAEGMTAITIVDQPLLLYRRDDGSVVALEDRCCHRLAPLSKGRREGDAVRCMYHGMKFAADGRCIEIPGQATIPAKAFVRTYEVAESGGWIWVWMGEAEKADRSAIPVSIATTDPGWRIVTGHLDYVADYQLINDNLLDLTHLSFAHEKTLGRGMPQWGEERPQMTRLQRGLRSQRWIRGVDSSHFLGHLGTHFDIWHSYDYLVPGIFLQRTNFHAAGSAEKFAGGPPQEGPLFSRLDEQAVTPMTAATARYFFAAGARHDDAGPQLVTQIFGHAMRAFKEDLAIIEAQHRTIEADPSRPMIATNSDVGPNLFRGLMKSLIDREAKVATSAAAG